MVDYAQLVRLIDEAIEAQREADLLAFSRAFRRVVEAIHAYGPVSIGLAHAQEYLSNRDIPLPRGTTEDSPERELELVEMLKTVRSWLTDPAMRS